MNMTQLNRIMPSQILRAITSSLLLMGLAGCQSNPVKQLQDSAQEVTQPLQEFIQRISHHEIFSGKFLIANEELDIEDQEIKLPLSSLELGNPPLFDMRELQQDVFAETLQIEDTPPITEPLENYVFSHPKVIYKNLWNQVSDNAFLAYVHIDDIKDYMKYYLRNKSYLKRVSVRAEPYFYYIVSEVNKRHMPSEVAMLPIIESGYYPFAKSYVSAAGLWQFMPATGHFFGLKRDWWYDGRQDILASTDAALDYLQKLYKMNDYDWLLALASYNAGYGNVLKAQRKYIKKHPGKTRADANYWEIRRYLPRETRHYVPQLLAISYLIKNRKQYNINLQPIENKPHFKSVSLTQQVALNRIAEQLNIKQSEMKMLNPGYLRSATPPNGPYKVLLPIEKVNQFEQLAANTPDLIEVNWTKYTIKAGDSLSVIAAKFRTTTKAIRQLNEMRTNHIRQGKVLLIPVPKSYLAQLEKEKQKNNKPTKSSYRGQKFTHTVKSGESLWTIARYYNVSTRTLCEWNGISIKKPLRKGQELEIRSSKYGRKLLHTLQKGESLWTIAQKYNVSTKEIAIWNGIKRSDVLQPGQTLQVWVKS